MAAACQVGNIPAAAKGEVRNWTQRTPRSPMTIDGLVVPEQQEIQCNVSLDPLLYTVPRQNLGII